MVLTSGVVKGRPPGSHSRPVSLWNTSHRNDTCRQEGHTGVNCSVHTTQPKPSNEATNHSRPRRGTGGREQVINGDKDIQWCRFMDPTVWVLFCFFAIKAKCRQRQAWGRKKNTKQTKKMRDCRTTKTIKARQDNTKQKAKAKHRLALNISNGITVANDYSK